VSEMPSFLSITTPFTQIRKSRLALNGCYKGAVLRFQ